MPGPGPLFGIAAALAFGGGDFTGALAARRGGVLVAVAGAQVTGLLLLLAPVAFVRPEAPSLAAIGLSLAAGLAGAAGLGTLYRGMAIGPMGLVTALGGVGSLVLPLIAGAVAGARVSPLQLVGVAFAAAAGAAASGASRSGVAPRALVMAGLAALSFGAWYVLFDQAAAAGDPLWVLLLSRVASSAATLALLVGRRPARPSTAAIPIRLIAVAGAFDVLGNAMYALARGAMSVGLAATLTGLYPVVTMLLARLVLGERLPPAGLVGVVLALLGTVLISLGGDPTLR